jgi:hypothetical protein
LIEATENGFHMAYDLPGLCYWLLTRQEELGRQGLDPHDRFPATASHAHRHGYLERPIVDEWLGVLGRVVQCTWPGVHLQQHTFCMRVSHDVDHPSRYGFRRTLPALLSLANDLLQGKHFTNGQHIPWNAIAARKTLHARDPYNTFAWLMDTSEAHGLRSAFYFQCGRTHPSKDVRYEPEAPAIRALLRQIHARGHEIGLHPSYGSYCDAARIAAETQRLLRVCAAEGITQPSWGGRMHYLRWRQPETLRALAAAGLAYDGTLGYADRVGFRCGTCHEYPAFDPQQMEALPIRIRPLIAMETSLFSKEYMGISAPDKVREILTSIKATCRAVAGQFTLLWHNSKLDTPSMKILYRQILGSHA